MRRTLMFAALATFALLLFAYISVTTAAPRDIPVLQSGQTESEPNDTFETADTVGIPGYAEGVLTTTQSIGLADTLDYFGMTGQSGRKYQATLSILSSRHGMKAMIRLYDGNRDLIDFSTASASNVTLSWSAYMDMHYILVEAVAVTNTLDVANYRLNVEQMAKTPIPTDTPTPTRTPVPSDEDDYEQHDGFTNNNELGRAYPLPVATSVALENLRGHATFHTPDDKDWYKFWAKAGDKCTVATSDLVDIDTYLEVYYDADENKRIGDGERVAHDDDTGGGYASRVEWKAKEEGYYYIRITNVAPNTTGSYDMKVEIGEYTDQPTSTPGPIPTNPKADRCDKTELGNHDFDHACGISPNESEEFNFCPPPYGGTDNDFFKIWVKPGLLFECATSKLSPGVDPNMILYDHSRNTIGGNDDVAPGDFNSYFAYYATYEGWLYVLVGTGDRIPPDPCGDSRYTLRCGMQLPGEATATSKPPTGTPGATATGGESQTPTSTPTPLGPPTPTPYPGLTVRPLTTPTPAPAITPAPRFIPIRLLIYHDANDDRQPGAGEGIAGISAQAYEVATNQLLAQGFTDEQGNLEFTVAAPGPVRVSIPFFGFSQLVSGEGASVYLRVPPQPLPGGVP